MESMPKIGETKNIPLTFLLFILFSGIALKVALAFSLPVYHDVGWYISLLQSHDTAFMNLIVLEHPPFGYYPYLLFLEIFGLHDFVLRFVPLLFGIVELALLYFIAKKWFGQRTADCTLLLFSVLYFAAINSLSPEGDGSIMAVFSILLFYCFSTYYESSTDSSHLRKQKYFLFLSGLFLGILLLIKIRAVLFVIPLFLYSYYRTKNIFITFKDFFTIGILSLLVFAVYPLQIYLANPNPALFIALLKQVVLHNTGTSSLLYKITHPLLFLQVVVVLSLLSLFLFFQGIFPARNKQITNRKVHDKIVLLVFWFCSLFFMLLLLLPKGLSAAYPRYISFLLPPLLLLCARGFALLPLKNRHLVLAFFGGILLGLVFLFFNQLTTSYWFFETAAMGIVKISKSILLFYLILSVLFLCAYFFSKIILRNKKVKRFFLLLFFILNIGFNLLLITDPVLDRTHEHIISDFQKYYQTHDVKKPIFLWAEDLAFYLGIPDRNINLITDPLLQQYAKSIGYDDQGYYYLRMIDTDSLQVLEQQGGTVFSLYYPLEYTLQVNGSRKQEFDYLNSHCELLASFDYTHAKGVIFEC